MANYEYIDEITKQPVIANDDSILGYYQPRMDEIMNKLGWPLINEQRLIENFIKIHYAVQVHIPERDDSGQNKGKNR